MFKQGDLLVIELDGKQVVFYCELQVSVSEILPVLVSYWFNGKFSNYLSAFYTKNLKFQLN